MKVLHARCAGLDVHKDLVVACARLQDSARVQREHRRFETTTKGLLELLAWLVELRCTHVAMEATGVYWKPVWHVLEGHAELVLANASAEAFRPIARAQILPPTLRAHPAIADGFLYARNSDTNGHDALVAIDLRR